MTPDCAQLDAFLDKRLEGPALATYQQHWPACTECTERVRHWSSFHQAALVWQGDNRALPIVTAAKADALVARARSRTEVAGFRWKRPALAAVGVALTAAVIAGVYSRGSTAQPAPWTAPLLVLDSTAEGVAAVGTELEAPEDGVLRARLGADRLALAAGSRVSVTTVSRHEVRLRLNEGTIALDIDPRAQGDSLWVDVGGVAVRVIGTRFRVAKEGAVTVLVNHGRVRVTDAQGVVREVGGGEILTLGEAETRLDPALAPDQQRLDSELDGTPPPPEDAQKPRPSRVRKAPPAKLAPAPAPEPTQVQVGQSNPVRLDGWRSQISGGRIEAARTSLLAHLKIAPLDFEAWLLLAECHRKLNNLNDAVAAYRVVIDGADRATANGARLLSANLQLEEGRDVAAAKLFTSYLDNAIPADAAALLKLGRAKIAAGRRADARAALERVVGLNRQAPEAQEAARLLETMR